MTRYTNADFGDDDSVNSVQLTEGISSSATHIRYHTGTTIWKRRTVLEKVLFLLLCTLSFIVVVLVAVLRIEEHRLRDLMVNNTILLRKKRIEKLFV